MSAFQVAEEHPDNTVTYPPGLPNDRGSGSMYCEVALVVMLLAIAGGVSSSQDSMFQTTLPLFCLCVFGLVAVQVIPIRLCQLFGEWRHIQGRYNGDIMQLLTYVWSMNMPTVLVGLCGLIFAIYYLTLCGNPFLLLHEVGPYSASFVFITAYVICHLINVEKSKLQNSINLEQMDGMDYGSGMAYNFFYGYLDIVLPDKGGGEKGLREKIEDYISKERLPDSSFPVKKLFIIIPSSAYTPSKLNEIADDDWMEPAGSLDPHILNRAGVTERVYKNSVYRIKNPNTNVEPVYVVAEGATPLKSLHDAVSRTGENQDFYREHLPELMSLFYKTLRKIIKADRGCRDLCELVYYIDLDEHGNRCVNVAELLLDRIQKLRNMQRR